MKTYDIAVIPESSKIKIFELTFKYFDSSNISNIENSYEELLEIYFKINQKFDEKHILDTRRGIIFDMELKES
jgi:hypothetical protein